MTHTPVDTLLRKIEGDSAPNGEARTYCGRDGTQHHGSTYRVVRKESEEG